MQSYDEPTGKITLDCAETTTFATFKFLVTLTDDRFVFCRYKIGNWSRSMSRGEMTSPWEKKKKNEYCS